MIKMQTAKCPLMAVATPPVQASSVFLAFCLSTVLWTSRSDAQVIFDANFNDLPVGHLVDTQSLEESFPWRLPTRLIQDVEGLVQVVDASGDLTDKPVLVSGPTGNLGSASFEHFDHTSQLTSGVVQVSWDSLVTRLPTRDVDLFGYNQKMIRIRAWTGGGWGVPWSLQYMSDGQLMLGTTEPFIPISDLPVGTYTPAVANHFDLSLDLDTKTFDLSIDGTSRIEGGELLIPGEFLGIIFSSNGRSQNDDRVSIAFDNLRVVHSSGVPGPTCDFDDNLVCDLKDVDRLVGEIVAGANDSAFDLTADGSVDIDDRDEWLAQAATANGFAAPYLLGDANLDGTVNAADLNNLGQNWLMSPNAWQWGDFTADGVVNASDLNQLGQNWLTSIPRAQAAVPEPAAATLAAIALIAVACGCRRNERI